MKYLKKHVLSAVLVFVCLLAAATTVKVYAANNRVTNIDIEVVIREDGSAYIIQYWTGSFYEGTENYIPVRTNDFSISEFAVSDENGAYTFVKDWDIDADFEEKAGKCGIVETDDGVELCFGISEYGRKEYTISYLVSSFIKSYQDYDGTNFMFINPEMSTFPTAGSIEIGMEDGTGLNESNAGIWGFGYEGVIEFQNGWIVAYTEKDLVDDNSMIVMLQLNKGLLSPRKTIEKSFVEVREEAMEDSDYGHGSGDGDGKAAAILVGAIFGGAALLIGVAAYSSAKRKEELKAFSDSVGYYSGVPNNGNMELTYYLARNFDVGGEESLIVGALMLSMMNEYAIELRSTADAFGNGQETMELRLLKEPDSAPERRLFYFLSAAARGTGRLQEAELEDYVYEHYEELEKLIKDTRENGKAAFQAQGGFLKGAGNCIKDLSENGKAQLAQVVGLKKYLEESAQMAERDIWEANLWQDYIVYATLFGVAEDVIAQLKVLFPDRVVVFDDYYYRYHMCYGYYHGMHRSMDRAIEAARSSGSGGSSSVGGGGGFSGGGVGGGSR